MKKGFSVIELLIVITVLSTLSVFTLNNFSGFQKDIVMNSASEQLASLIKTARAKSMSGEIGEGESYVMFEPDHLPVYGVEASGNTFSLFREYTLAGSTETKEVVQIENFDPSLSFSGDPIKFSRVLGTSTSTEFVVEKTGVSEQRLVQIDAQGVVTITKATSIPTP